MKTTVLRQASPLTDEYVATEEVNVFNLDGIKVLIDFEKGKSSGCIIEAEFTLDGENWYVQSCQDGTVQYVRVTPVKRCFMESISTMFALYVESGSISMRLKAKASTLDVDSSVEGTSLKLLRYSERKGRRKWRP
jgi:hypothetical protein